MCLASANAFISKELHKFNDDIGKGYFDSLRFNGISLSRIDCLVNSPIEICKVKESAFLGIHICLQGCVEYSVGKMVDPYHVDALQIRIVSDELGEVKSRVSANRAISEVSIFLSEQACNDLLQWDKFSAVAGSKLNGNLSICDMGALHKTLLHLINFSHPQNQFEIVALQGYCLVIVGEILNRVIQNNTAAAPVKLASAERVKSLIDSNVKNNQTIRQLANLSGTNECYLKKEFKELTGCSIVDYRQRQRIRHAQVLLGQGLLNIDALAAEVGYQNTDHFVRIFRRHIGFHPREYRTGRVSKTQ